MNFIASLFRRPISPIPDRNPINGQYSASPRTRQMRRNAETIEAELRDYNASTTQKQRAAEFGAYEAVAAALRKVMA